MIKHILRVLIILGLLGILTYSSLFAYVCIAEKNLAPRGRTDVIIVLGAQVRPDGTPSVQLEYRLEAALAVYQEQPQTIVCCGGQAGKEPRPEGEVMRDWLIAHGVPETDVLAENDSGNTRQNLRNAVALLPRAPEKVLIVTSDYHLPRALSIARDIGLNAVGEPAVTLPEYWLKNHAREALSWGKYLVEKVLGK